MGVRFRHAFKSIHNNIDWVVEFLDVNYSSTVTDIELEAPGFTLTWHQSSDERFEPIKASECEVLCVISDNSAGASLASWINSSVNSTKENQYFLNITKNGETYWFGVILSDVTGTREDMSRPYLHSLKATDGLKRLETIPFPTPVVQVVPSARKSFIELIYSCLENTPLKIGTTQTTLFSTVVDWYNSEMPAKADIYDPLLFNKIEPFTFATSQQGEPTIPMNCYEVLTKICQHWGMRVMLSDGIFRFYQVNAFEDDGSPKYERYYNRLDGQFGAVADFDYYNYVITNSDFPHVKTGNQFQWFPPLKLVETRQDFGVQTNLLDFNTSMDSSGTTHAYEKDLIDGILGGTNRKLRFQISLQINNLASNQLRVYVKLKIGSYYLLRSRSGAVSWSTNSASTYDVFFDNFRLGQQTVDVSFETPDIPSGTHNSNEFLLTSIGAQITPPLNRNPIVFTPVANIPTTRVQGSTRLFFNTAANKNEADYFKYIARNTTSDINSYSIESEPSIFGVYPYSTYPGHIWADTGAGDVPTSASWGLGGDGELDFTMLRIREILIGQTRATAKYQGEIIGLIDAHSSINYDSKRWIFNGGNYNPTNESFDGEWYEVITVPSAFDPDVYNEPIDGGGGDTQLRREIGDVTDRVNDVYPMINSIEIFELDANVSLNPITATYHCINALTITLPPAADWLIGGRSVVIRIKNAATSGGDSITINPDGTEKIDGASSKTLTHYKFISLYSDGVNIFEF